LHSAAIAVALTPRRLTIALTSETTIADAYQKQAFVPESRDLKNAILCPELGDSVMLNDRNKF